MQEKGIHKKNVHKRKVYKQKVLTTRDIVFKKVFASPENNHILKGFINDILGLDVVEVTVENAYNIKTFYNEQGETGLQYTQVDVLTRLREGSLVSVEMQVCQQFWYRERALFYTAETYTSNYGKKDQENVDKVYHKGEWKYSALRPVYSICILLENEFDDDESIHTFNLYDKKHGVSYTNHKGEELVTMTFLELRKQPSEEEKNITEWFRYFKTGEVSESAPEYMREACKVANYQNLSKEEQEMVSAREKAEQDALSREYYVWTQGIEKGVKQGIEKGTKTGRAEARNELICNMLKQGLNTGEIAQFTGVSQAEIESVKEKSSNAE